MAAEKSASVQGPAHVLSVKEAKASRRIGDFPQSPSMKIIQTMTDRRKIQISQDNKMIQ